MKTFVFTSIVSVLAFGLSALAAPSARPNLNKYDESAKEIRAIVASPGVAAKSGDAEITSIRLVGNSQYEVSAGNCEMMIQIGYELPVYPPQPSVHIQSTNCRP